MSTINDFQAKNMLHDRTDFKLSVAKKYLEKIKSIPYSENVKDFQLEICAEGFLKFSNGVIEILTYEINEKFKIFQYEDYQVEYISYEENLTDDESQMIYVMNKGGKHDKFLPNFNIYKLLSKLDHLNSDQKKIIDLIQKYFEYPIQSKNNWDFTNSSLWQLKEIRNTAEHNPSLNRNYVIGSRQDVQYIFRFNLNDKSNNQIVRVVKNPQNYFKELFDKLVEFRNEIRLIIPHRMPSNEYKKQLDFALQF
jgi:hypothetical protein